MTYHKNYYYDADDRIETVKSPQGYVRYSYSNIIGQKIETRTYLPTATLTSVRNNDNTDQTRIEYAYDEIGRLAETAVIKRDGTVLGTPEITTYDLYD